MERYEYWRDKLATCGDRQSKDRQYYKQEVDPESVDKHKPIRTSSEVSSTFSALRLHS